MNSSTTSAGDLRPRQATEPDYDAEIGVLHWDEPMSHHHHNRDSHYHPHSLLTEDMRYIPTMVNGNTSALLHSISISPSSSLSPPEATACITMNPLDSAMMGTVGVDSQHIDHSGHRISSVGDKWPKIRYPKQNWLFSKGANFGVIDYKPTTIPKSRSPASIPGAEGAGEGSNTGQDGRASNRKQAVVGFIPPVKDGESQDRGGE